RDVAVVGQPRHERAPRLAQRHRNFGPVLTQRLGRVKADAFLTGNTEHEPALAGQQGRDSGRAFAHFTGSCGNHTPSDASPSRSYSRMAFCTVKLASTAGRPPTHIARRALASSSFSLRTPRCSSVFANKAAVW